MIKNDPLLDTLLLMKACAAPMASGVLCESLGVGVATLKRYIREARHLGADIQAVKVGARWYYFTANWSACQKIADRWIELQQQRSVV